MELPTELRYTSEHEWVRVEGPVATVGITDYAQDALGDVVYVALPTPGAAVAAAEAVAEVESTKSVSEVYAPVAGTVAEVNRALDERPELLNDDPYGDGWIFRVEMSDPARVEDLLDHAGYRALVEG